MASGYQSKRKKWRAGGPGGGLECDNKVAEIYRQRGRSVILVGVNTLSAHV